MHTHCILMVIFQVNLGWPVVSLSLLNHNFQLHAEHTHGTG